MSSPEGLGKGGDAMRTGSMFNPYKIFTGVFIPNCLVKYKGVSQSAKLLWGRLAQFAGDDGHCYPTHEKLAEELGIDKRSIIRALKELEGDGFLKIIRPKGINKLQHKPNIYYFLWHCIFEPQYAHLHTSDSDENVTSSSGENVTSIKRTNENKLKESNNTSNEVLMSNKQFDLSVLPNLWNEICKSLPKVKEVSKERKRKEALRLKERTVKDWALVFKRIEASHFCKGDNQSGWRATYDWIIHNHDNAIKVLEGKYSADTELEKELTPEYIETMKHLKARGAPRCYWKDLERVKE